jgi:hypothetical protein
MLHARPHTAQVDRVHAIECLGSFIGHVARGSLHAGIVERRIQPPEGGDGLLDHGRYLSLISNIATDANRFVTGGEQVARGGANSSLSDIRERDGSACFCESFGGCQADARSGTRHEDDSALKKQVHNEILSSPTGEFICSIARR